MKKNLIKKILTVFLVNSLLLTLLITDVMAVDIGSVRTDVENGTTYNSSVDSPPSVYNNNLIVTWYDAASSWEMHNSLVGQDGSVSSMAVPTISPRTDDDSDTVIYKGLSNGNLLVYWYSGSSGKGFTDTYFKIVDQSGNDVVAATKINSEAGDLNRFTDCAELSNGDLAFVWSSSGSNHALRRFSISGSTATPVDANQISVTSLDGTTGLSQYDCKIAANQNGRFMIITDVYDYNYRGIIFDNTSPTPVQVGGQNYFVISNRGENDHICYVKTLSNNNFLTVYRKLSGGTSTSDRSIAYQVFNDNGTSVAPEKVIRGLCSWGYIDDPIVSGDGFFLSYSYLDYNTDPDTYVQYFEYYGNTDYTASSPTDYSASVPTITDQWGVYYPFADVDGNLSFIVNDSTDGGTDYNTYLLRCASATPTVTSISPAAGPTAGGTSVTITGTNFTGATAVKFGTTDADSYTVDSATQITATAPAHAASTVDVTITTASGTSATSANDQFTYDGTAPTLDSAVRNSDTQITVALSEGCQNLTAANNGGFTVTKTGTGTTYAVSATAQGSDASHVVLTVADMATAGAVGVTVTYTAGANGTIADTAGNVLATDTVGAVVAAWDTTAPTVIGIDRNNPASALTNTAGVACRVTFSEAVTGVDAADFTITVTGTAAGTIDSVSAVNSSTYDVDVNTITGDGTLRLDLNASGTGIADIGGTSIADGGYTSGQVYTIDNTAPTLDSAVRNSDTQITVALSEDCQNLAAANDGGFTVTKTGTGTTYAVAATAQGADASHVVLTVADMATAGSTGVTVTYTAGGNGTIADTAGNTLATDAVGAVVAAWDTTAPSVSSINRQTPASEATNANSVTYRVTFSEAITGVDTSDFTVSTTGTATGTIDSVSAVNSSTYDVTVNTITGDGTLRLDLNASGTGIADIGGMSIADGGYTSGQVYTLDTSAPTLASAAHNSDTQITVTLSEDCQNLIKANNGGFTVTKTGTGTTYAVSATAQGSDASHVVLTVADMATAGSAGVTVTYTAGGNGTIADLAGNTLATDGTGSVIAAWDTTAPTVSSIDRQTPASEATNAASVTYRVTFSEAVTGVDTSDFTVSTTGTATGTIDSVSAVNSSTYDVTVNTITGDGTLRLDLNASGTGIADIGGTSIADVGYTSGQVYTIDNTAPTLDSVVRNSDTQITVTLSENCQNLIKANNGGFTVTKTGTGTTYAVTATAQGSDVSHVVLTVADMATAGAAGITVTYTAGGNGTIADLAGNALATDGTGSVIAAWDTTAPTVSSINRQTPASETTNASSVTYRVTFYEAVTGVDTTDFTVSTTGTATGSVSSVSPVDGSTYDVTVNTITGVGTLRLDLKASGTGIADIGGTSIDDGGYTSGQVYTIDKTAPMLDSAARNSDTQITVALSEGCQNLTAANNGGFTVTKTGTGTTYAVTATAQGSDSSHVVLTVADMATAGSTGVTVTYTAGGNGTIADTAGNVLATDAVGAVAAAWDTTAPTVSSLNRQTPAAATTNANSVTYRVTFSEAVTGVDTSDFTVSTTGTATGTIASVSAVNISTYDVTVSTITGDGTLRLDLNASGTGIADIGGTSIANGGYTSGQVYAIDKTAPTLDSAVRNSDTQITVGLSEDCQNLIKANDGGFIVCETGTPATTYAVSSITQGADASHVVLTVADMDISAKEGITVKYTLGGNGTVQDTAGNTLASDNTGVSIAAWDTTAPTITSSTVSANYTYIDITFSDGVYGAGDGSSALTATKLALTFTQNSGVATNAVISSLKQNDDTDEGAASALDGGETTVRVFLTVTGTPSGTETIEIKPADGASIYDTAGNAMEATQTTGAKTLVNAPPPFIGGGSTGGSTTGGTGNMDANLEINGDSYSAGTSETGTNASGQTVTTVTVDTDKLQDILEIQGQGATVKIPVATGSTVASGVLTGDMVDTMEQNGATLVIDTGSATYTLPAEEININAVSEQLGENVSLGDITVTVSVSSPSDDMVTVVENTAENGGYTLVVPAVSFTVSCSYGDQTVDVTSFDTYVDRTIIIPNSVDPNQITTAIVVNPDGTTHSVPTNVFLTEDGYYAVRIRSLTNSVYTVIYNPVEFPDVENHWASDAINDMGSRMIVAGDLNGNFNPDNSITRAEFAAIMVRALGLAPGDGTNRFSDVVSSSWYCGYVKTATAYGIITGYDDGTFRPNDLITREQAMTILARAMDITKLSPSLSDSQATALLVSYSDSTDVSIWAKTSIAACLETGVITGRTSTTLSPKENITRAEVAVAVQKLLQKSELI